MLPVEIVAWARRAEGSSRNKIVSAATARGNNWLRVACKRVIHFPFGAKDGVNLTGSPQGHTASFSLPVGQLCECARSISTTDTAAQWLRNPTTVSQIL